MELNSFCSFVITNWFRKYVVASVNVVTSTCDNVCTNSSHNHATFHSNMSSCQEIPNDLINVIITYLRPDFHIIDQLGNYTLTPSIMTVQPHLLPNAQYVQFQIKISRQTWMQDISMTVSFVGGVRSKIVIDYRGINLLGFFQGWRHSSFRLEFITFDTCKVNTNNSKSNSDCECDSNYNYNCYGYNFGLIKSNTVECNTNDNCSFDEMKRLSKLRRVSWIVCEPFANKNSMLASWQCNVYTFGEKQAWGNLCQYNQLFWNDFWRVKQCVIDIQFDLKQQNIIRIENLNTGYGIFVQTHGKLDSIDFNAHTSNIQNIQNINQSSVQFKLIRQAVFVATSINQQDKS